MENRNASQMTSDAHPHLNPGFLFLIGSSIVNTVMFASCAVYALWHAESIRTNFPSLRDGSNANGEYAPALGYAASMLAMLFMVMMTALMAILTGVAIHKYWVITKQASGRLQNFRRSAFIDEPVNPYAPTVTDLDSDQ